MDATGQGRAMGLLGAFNDDMTRMFDDAIGSRWAEIEEIVAISAIASGRTVTTRDLSAMTRLSRRAVSRLVAELTSAGLVQTRRAEHDRRSVAVVFTPTGERRAAALRVATDAFFREGRETALTIRAELGSLAAAQPPAPPADAMDLLRRVCEAGIALVRAMPDAATDGRLAARQRAALVLIASQAGVRPRELAPALGVSRAGAAYIIDQLCAKAFVARHRGTLPEDRRAVVLRATPEGERAVGMVAAAIASQSENLAAVFGEIARWGESGHSADASARP